MSEANEASPATVGSEVERTARPIVEGEVRIIYEHGMPHGIRDKTGFLVFFTRAQKYEGQEERYRQDIDYKYRIADYLLKALKGRG